MGPLARALALAIAVVVSLASCSASDNVAPTPSATPPAPMVMPVPMPSEAAEAGDAATLFDTTRAEVTAEQSAHGNGAALALLEQRIGEIPALEGVCHAIAHELGHAAVMKADANARTAIAEGSEVCGGGYTHGVVEMALGDSKHIERDLLRICAPANTGSCFHGVGHGAMFATGMDVDESMRLCDLAPSRMLSARCGEGIFMQLFSSDLSAQHVAGEQATDISHHPNQAGAYCRTIRTDYAPNCWFYAPTVYLAESPDDYPGAMAWCREAGSELGRQVCARGVGSRTVKYHPDDLTIGAGVCAAAGALKDSCLQGMGSYWSVHHGGEVPSSDVCRHLPGKRLRADCRRVV